MIAYTGEREATAIFVPETEITERTGRPIGLRGYACVVAVEVEGKIVGWADKGLFSADALEGGLE